MPVTLTPETVLATIGGDVSEADITVASAIIHAATGSTPSEHVDDRSIAASSVQYVWSIVARRVREQARTDPSWHAYTSESQGDYSYTAAAAKLRPSRDFLEGWWHLLEITPGVWGNVSGGDRPGHGWHWFFRDLPVGPSQRLG